MIITKELVTKAVELVRPTAEAILTADGTTWGPRWIDGYVSVPGLEDIQFRFGQKTEWNLAWGEERPFAAIAKAKLQLTKRMGDDTSIVTAICPWQLQEGEYLYPGGCSRWGISASASGAKGRADEAIATLVVYTVIMLAHLETDRRREAKQMQI